MWNCVHPRRVRRGVAVLFVSLILTTSLIAQSAPEPALAYHEVDPAVGNVRNQGERLIAPMPCAADGLFP